MAFDSIWQQQLSLVCYGNEYLSQQLSIEEWKQNSVFNQHLLQFRDLTSQHLLAQHFQVWLEHLKQNGCTKLSLHSSSILQDEKNPNPNVELLPYAHFIVSHSPQKATAWICGHELAEWYSADNEYEFPQNQQTSLRIETLWRFELPAPLAKAAQADLQAPDWEKIADYLDAELLEQPFAEQLNVPQHQDFVVNTTSQDGTATQALLPAKYHAQLANDLLFKLTALQQRFATQKHNPLDDENQPISVEQQREQQHFAEKTDALFVKLIVKIANHYQTAQRKVVVSPFEQNNDDVVKSKSKNEPHNTHVSAKNVIALIFVTLVICICAYYWGL